LCPVSHKLSPVTGRLRIEAVCRQDYKHLEGKRLARNKVRKVTCYYLNRF
jgi:hypothetical protein